MLARRRDLQVTPSKLRRQRPLREGPASAALACPRGCERQPRYRLAKINFNAKGLGRWRQTRRRSAIPTRARGERVRGGGVAGQKEGPRCSGFQVVCLITSPA